MSRFLGSRGSVLLFLVVVLLGSTLWSAHAGQGRGGANQPGVQPGPAPAGSCPGKEGPTQYTGKTEVRPIANAVVNGKPMTGTWSEAGAHSYWHCHPGGQFLIVMEGVGRAQKRGERMRDLKVGEIEYAGPWVEHWHGAAPNSSSQFLQVALQPTGTRWEEAVSDDDYLGNDDGISSRNAYIRSLK
jgi:quercetin dioxygenase-like cupin family protein